MKSLFPYSIFVKYVANLCKYIFTQRGNEVKKYSLHLRLKLKCDANFFQPGLKLKISHRGKISHVTVQFC